MDFDNITNLKEPGCIKDAINSAINEKHKTVVVIKCAVYNQDSYISECLEGFIMQQTNFPFVAVVHDDASSDNTASIISTYAKKYPKTIKAVCDPVNRYTERSLGKIMDALADAYSPEYCAICEGDDFWTDPYKLQKQVDYMENHPECVMCHTDCITTNELKKNSDKHFDDEPYFGPNKVHCYSIYTLTALYRKKTYDQIPHHFRDKKWLMGDYPLWIELSQKGKFHFINEITGTYRVQPNSASHSTDINKIVLFWNNINEITKFYYDLYGYRYVAPQRKDLYYRIIKQCYYNHNKEKAKQYWNIAKNEKQITIKMFVFYLCNVYNMSWMLKLLYKLS